MKLTIARPDYSSSLWAEIPSDHRTEIRAMLEIFDSAPSKGVTTWLQAQARSLGVSYGKIRQKYYALRSSGGDWTVLIDHRKADSMPAPAATTREPRFVSYLLKLVESYQRKSAPAFRELRRRWRIHDQPIPGYEKWEGWPQIPAGWSNRNLADIVTAATNKAVTRAIRVGTSSKTNRFLPHVITTRVGLWPGAVIQFDDMWHNNYVSYGKDQDIVRVLELGALDVFSGHRFHWGAKPRRKKENGKYETLAGKDMRLFVAGMLHRYGRCPQGMMFMSENQTAKIDEDIAKLLYDTTGGMIYTDYQPIEGKQAALSGYWHGTEGGNFRAKACLESTHALMQNDLSALALQTGSPSSGLKGPVTTDRIISYIARILLSVREKVPHRLDLLRLPSLDFHSQFIPFLQDYYHYGLGLRTDHQLEGWERLNHVITEYTTQPGSDLYLSEKQFLDLDPVTQSIIGREAARNPRAWKRRRALSPFEVFQAKPNWEPVPIPVICDIIGHDLAREQKAERGFITFEDKEIAPDPLVYQARYVSGPRRGQEIGHGEKVLMFVFPFDDTQTAIAVDAKGKFLGELALETKVLPINPAAFGSTAPYDQRPDIRSAELRDAAGIKHERIANMMEGARIRHAEAVQEARDLRAHNKRLLDPDQPATPEEIADHLHHRDATRFGKAVRMETDTFTPDHEAAPSEDWSDAAPAEEASQAPIHNETW